MNTDGGQITIGTAIDTGGFEDGMNKILDKTAELGAAAERQSSTFTEALNGIPIAELTTKIQDQKDHITELNQTILAQKNVVNDIAKALQDLKDQYATAKENDQTMAMKKLAASIKTVQGVYNLAKQELKDFTLEQANARMELQQMKSAYDALSSISGSSYETLILGATNAAEKVAALKQNFAEMQVTSQAAEQGIAELSQQSQQSAQTAAQLKQEISDLSTAMRFGDGDMDTETQTQGLEAIKTKINEYGEAVAQQSATATAAFEQQKQYVSDLEKQIDTLQKVMQEASAAGDFKAAGEAATEIQKLSATLTTAKEKMTELASQSAAAKEAIARVADEQVKMEEAANRGGSFFGNFIDAAGMRKIRVTEAYDTIATAVQPVTEKISSAFQTAHDAVVNTWSNISQKIGFDRLGQQFDGIGGKITSFITGNGKAQEAVAAFGKSIDGLGIPFTAAVKGINTMTAASLRFLATPIGAVLGAIVLALKALHTWFTKSAEGQKAFTSISAYFGSIMSSITDIVIAFGKYLYHAFADNTGTMNAFAKSFVNTISKAFSAAKDILFGFGGALKGVFTLDWDTFADGVKQLGTGLTEGVPAALSAIETSFKGITGAFNTVKGMFTDEELGKSLSDAFTNMLPKAKQAAALAQQELSANTAAGQAREKAARLDKDIAKGREKIYTLTGKAKDAEIERVKALMKEKYDYQISAQRQLLSVQKQRNKLHKATLNDLKKEHELRIGVLQQEAAQAASARMLTRMQQANLRSMASAAKSEDKAAASAANKAKNQANSLTAAQEKLDEVLYQNLTAQVTAAAKLEKDIADARIAAMKDGYDRARAEKAEENRQELLAIEEQRVKAVEAERKRQKAEFDAQQAVIKAQGGRTSQWDESQIDQSAIKKINDQYASLATFTQQKQEREEVDELSETYNAEITDRQNQLNKLKSDIAAIKKNLASAQTDEEKASVQAMLDNAEAQLKWVSASKDAWVEYYSKYGNFIEKKQALDEKFAHDTQGMSQSSPQYAALKKEYEADQSALVTENLKKSVNWETMFGDMSKQSLQSLQYTLDKAKALFEANKDSMNPSDIMDFSSALDKMENEIASRNPFTAFHKSIQDISKSKTELITAMEEWKTAQQEVTTAQQEYNEAKAQLAELQELVSEGKMAEESQEYAEALQRVTTAQNEYTKATSKAATAETNVLQKRNNLTNSYKSFSTQLKNVGSTVTGVGQKAKALASVFSDDVADGIGKACDFVDEVLDATSSVISAIGDVGKNVASGVESTVQATASGTTAAAAAGATAISTIEKASVILAVISAALQVATAIANLFNNDDSKQKEIEKLQERIDQLQWELDNADAVRLQENMGDAVERVKKTYNEVYNAIKEVHTATVKYTNIWARLYDMVQIKADAYRKTVEKLADAYAKADYTADKLLGEDKYNSAREELENLAEQQLLLNQQMEKEQSKKKTDSGKVQEYKEKIAEVAEEMASVINDMMEEIIGYSAEDLASELGDAFFEAASQGEDAMEQWHSTAKGIINDILKQMLVTQLLEQPIGEIFNKYKKKWFGDDGKFKGINEVNNSMQDLLADLDAVGSVFEESYDALSDGLKDLLLDEDAERDGTSKGIATASQESVDENNARLTTIQGHTYTLVQGMGELNRTSTAILDKVSDIEKHTNETNAKLDTMNNRIRNVESTVDDIYTKGIKLKS